MQTQLFFIRHADASKETPYGLTEQGIKSLHALKLYFHSIQIDKIYSSPLLRAVQTVQAIAEEKKLPVLELDQLKERVLADEFIEDFDSFVRSQWENFGYKLKGGESLYEVRQRASSVIHKIANSSKGKRVIIGTHGTFLSVYLNSINKEYDFAFWKNLARPAVYWLAFENGIINKIKQINYLEV